MSNTQSSPKLTQRSGRSLPRRKRGRSTAGFSLLELLVGIGLMVVLGGMVFGLFNRHAQVYKLQQEVTELNMGLRSAMDLVTADLVNAGSNLSTAGATGFPFSVIVKKNARGNFDSITIYQGLNPNSCEYLPPTYLTDMHGTGTGVNGSGQTANSSTLFIDPAFFPAAPACNSDCNASVDARNNCTAARLPTGSFVVIVNIDRNDANLGQIAPITLTQDSLAQGGQVRVRMNHNPNGDTDAYSGLLGAAQEANKLGIAFPRGSMVVKLGPPITYDVDNADPDHPVLMRKTKTSLSESDLRVASNILGFSQRAHLANGRYEDDPDNYTMIDPTNGTIVDAKNDYSQIMSLEVTIAGRTQTDRIDAYQSAIDPTKTFRLNTLTTAVAIRNKLP